METQTAPVDVTERAAEKALQLGMKEGHGEDVCLRLRVLAGGCSGFSYKLSFEDGPAPIVAGSTIEFLDAMLGGGFKVNNPQAVSECSCGESFSV
jgi:iron-sulfur cluster assembly protein